MTPEVRRFSDVCTYPASSDSWQTGATARLNEHNGWVPSRFLARRATTREKQGPSLDPGNDRRRTRSIRWTTGGLTSMKLDPTSWRSARSRSQWRVFLPGLTAQGTTKLRLSRAGFPAATSRINMGTIDVSLPDISRYVLLRCAAPWMATAATIVHWWLDARQRSVVPRPCRGCILQAGGRNTPDARPRLSSDRRAAVPRQGLHGIHPYLEDDARENVALLSTVERQVGALAQIVEERMYSAGRAADAGGCASADPALCRALQGGALAQRDRVGDAGSTWMVSDGGTRSTPPATASWSRLDRNGLSAAARRTNDGWAVTMVVAG